MHSAVWLAEAVVSVWLRTSSGLFAYGVNDCSSLGVLFSWCRRGSVHCAACGEQESRSGCSARLAALEDGGSALQAFARCSDAPAHGESLMLSNLGAGSQRKGGVRHTCIPLRASTKRKTVNFHNNTHEHSRAHRTGFFAILTRELRSRVHSRSRAARPLSRASTSF